MKRIGILSDTHGHMDERILHHLNGCDEIWHAGDVGSLDVLAPLREMATLRAVYGNIDGGTIRRELPEWACFDCEGIRVGIIHIAGRPGKYPARVNSMIRSENAGMLVCGHSHICLVHRNPLTGFIHINPGAAGRHGFHKVRTLIRLHLNDGRVENPEVVELGLRSV